MKLVLFLLVLVSTSTFSSDGGDNGPGNSGLGEKLQLEKDLVFKYEGGNYLSYKKSTRHNGLKCSTLGWIEASSVEEEEFVLKKGSVLVITNKRDRDLEWNIDDPDTEFGGKMIIETTVSVEAVNKPELSLYFSCVSKGFIKLVSKTPKSRKMLRKFFRDYVTNIK